MTFTNTRKSIWAFEGSQEDLGHPGTELRAAQQQVLQQQCRQALNSGLPPRVLPRKGVVPSTLWLVVASHRGRD
jgi:hypothetical protein